jgi:hypothetical protein
VARLRRGQVVVLVMPVLDRSRDLRLTAIAKRRREWRAALARDRRATDRRGRLLDAHERGAGRRVREGLRRLRAAAVAAPTGLVDRQCGRSDVSASGVELGG